ncbi:hypothetical protein DMN91_004636 [Ooceraea biroi]|uniref:CHK kinase-like domain-containing protein n=1 Tax=Ooceraea biroi TaxID=2015173 RepID=A0A026WZD6_OOCBI|nr:uncharacterized protein LOC105287671 [Ooceraea biroi]EZA61173.1 hypothetical protein X777_08385 [Ooceraea biroi]RLU22358.1 hypothetical protein DMN91_004636 [Ooceraea biroi]
MDIRNNSYPLLRRTVSVSNQCRYICYGCPFVKDLLIKELFTRGLLWTPHLYDHISVQHFMPYETTRNILLRVSVRCSQMQNHFQFIAKLPKARPEESKHNHSFRNEVLFYSIRKNFRNRIFPNCYFGNHSPLKSAHPVVVLEDLTKCGFAPFERKLNKSRLIICVKLLATFHANTYRLQKENNNIYVFSLFEILKRESKKERIEQRKERVRVFLSSTIMSELDNVLRTKIKRKLKKVELLKTDIASTIIHGCFTRSNIFVKYDDQGCRTKLIDFQAIKYDSPSIDFGRIFLTNLPNEHNVSKLENMFKIILHTYLEKLKKDYPRVIFTLVRQDIVHNMILSYINLNDEEKEAIENHKPILHMLNKIGSFD